MLLTSLADQQEPGKRKHALVRDSRPGLAREEDRDIDPDKATDTNIALDFTIYKFSLSFITFNVQQVNRRYLTKLCLPKMFVDALLTDSRETRQTLMKKKFGCDGVTVVIFTGAMSLFQINLRQGGCLQCNLVFV